MGDELYYQIGKRGQEEVVWSHVFDALRSCKSDMHQIRENI